VGDLEEAAVSVPIIAFFNNKGGVGNTSLVYHLAWMYSDLGVRVVAADLDPRANLTAAFLEEEYLEDYWGKGRPTIGRCVDPLERGLGDIAEPELERVSDNLGLLVGDLSLSGFEGELSEAWPKSSDGDERAFRVMSAFWRIMQRAAEQWRARFILMDLSPNRGAINRAALIATDFVVVPLSPDLFSLQGLQSLGPTLRKWRTEWEGRTSKNPDMSLALPAGRMEPAGYIVLPHSVRLDRPVEAYDKWMARIPPAYRRYILGQDAAAAVAMTDDPNCLSLLRHYRSLMPMAQEARKPMFHLKPADGAIGAHYKAVQGAFQDFRQLASNIAVRIGEPLPDAGTS
jgi:chromosome partitioning protein